MRTVILGLLVVGCVVAQEAAKDDKGLVGTWEAVSAVKAGETVGEEKLKDLSLTLDEKTITIKDGPAQEKGSYKTGVEGSLKTIDISADKAPPGKAVLGIYELDEGTLKMIWAKPGTARPKDFMAKGEEYTFLTFKRKK